MSSIQPSKARDDPRPAQATEPEAPSELLASGSAAAWRADVLRRRLLAGADVSVVLTVLFAFGLERGTGITLIGFLLLAASVAVVAAKTLGLYDRDHRVLWHTTADELAPLGTWSVVVTVAFVVILPSLGTAAPEALVLVAFMVGIWGLAIGLRSAARRLWRQVSPRERVLILGSGPVERAVRRKFELFHHLHVELVGTGSESQPMHIAPSRDIGCPLPPGVSPTAVDRLLVAAASPDERLIARLVPYCRQHKIKLGLIPPARGMFGTAVQLDHVAELPIVQYNTWDVSRSTRLGKRLVDLVVSVAALIALAPLLAILAAAVKTDSRGPVLFRQRRAGQHGRPFTILKFRSMVPDAEAKLSEVVDVGCLSDPVFKLRSDPRVTTVGRILRRSSADELPQLWNVFRGQMSLVGPRPEELALVELYPAEARAVRLAVRPGLTGPMQVYGRGSLTLEERIAVEREYVDNLSLTRDLRILARTAAAVARGQGAL